MKRHLLLFRACFVLLILSAFTLNASAQNCTVNAGIDGAVCPGDAFILKGKTNGNTVLSGGVPAVWTQVGGPAVTIGTAVITTNGDGSKNVNAPVTGYAPGNTYKFRLSSQCSDGSLIYQEVEYSTKAANLANAGANLLVCPGTSSPLAANTLGAGESGTWSIVGSTNGISINNPSSPTTTLSVPSNQSGVTTLRWTLSNTNGCISTSDITVSNGGGVTPVTAGGNQTLNDCYNLTQATQLNGSYAGDNTRGQQGTWELVSGPSGVTFDNKNVNNTWVRGLVEGTYILRWNVSGPCANGTPTVQITVPAPKKGITTVGNSVQTFCDTRTTAILNGPVPGITGESVSWVRLSGTGTVDNPASPTTTVSGLTAGSTSTFRYTVTSTSGCSSSGVYTVNYVSAPTISLTAPTTSPITLNCGDNTTSIPFTYTGGDQTQWMLVSAPAGASIISVAGTGFNNVSGNSLSLIGLNKIGTYIIRLKRTTNNGAGGCADAFMDVAVIVSQQPTPSNAGTKQFLACNVTETDLAGNDAVNGTGKWSIVSQPLGSPAVNVNNVTNPTTHISNLVNGAYTFRWIITGNDGCDNKQSDVTVLVASTTPTQANAGANLSVCNATPITLNGNEPVLNETGTWTSTPAVMFSDPHDPKAVISGLAASAVYQLTWTITNACGTTSHTVTYTSTATAGPKQSVASADAAACLATGTTVNLTGNAPGSGEVGTWTQVGTTPAVVSFTSTTPGDGKTTVNGMSAEGTYKFKWSLEKNSPGCVASEAIVSVTKSAATTVATASAASTAVCGTSTSLTGSTPAATETGTWTQVEGPGGAVITTPNSPNTTITGLSAGRFTFRWTIANGVCASTYADVKINVALPPTPALIGGVTNATAAICDADASTTYTLNGNDVSAGGSGLWTIVSGPNNPTFSSFSAYNAVLSNLVAGTYQLKWTSSSGFICPVSEATLALTIQQKAIVQNATVTFCATPSVELRGSEGSTGVWTLTSGPASTITAISGSTNAALATTATPGVYVYTYSVTGSGACAGTTTATKTVTISGTPSAATITKVNSVTLANNQYTYCMGAASTFTVPLEVASITTGTGSWSILSKPAAYSGSITGSGTNFSLPNAVPGSYLLAWNVSNGACGTNQDIVRVILEHDPTVANAGSNQNNACNSTVVMAGNTPVYGVGVWSKISGDASAVIDQPNNPTTKILNAAPGTYVFRWTITTGCSSSTSDVTIQVSSTPPNTANAGTAQELCNVTTVNLSGNATTGAETGLWTRLSGPNTPTITSSTSNNTSVTGMVAGTYVFQWQLNNGTCVSTSTVQVKINAAPSTADAGSGQTVCLYSPLTLAATAPASGTGTWSVITKPGTQNPVFSNLNANNATVNGLEVGTYVFRWTVANGNCTPAGNYSDVTVTVNPPVTASSTGAQQVVCVGSTVTLAGNQPAVGTGAWTVNPAGPVITNAALYNTTVTNLTVKGTYLFTWTISGSCGTSASTTQVIVQDAPGNNSFVAPSDICYNTTATFTGSDPTGGDGTNYTYKWQQSTNNVTYTDIASSNTKSYTTGQLTTSTWFRRVVTSGVCGIASTSTPLQVNVLADITGNTLTYGGTTSFCTTGDPSNITGGTSLAGGGGGPYTYKWQRSTDGTTFTDIVGANSADYDPVTETAGGSILNVYYRRIATSASNCTIASNVIQVTVLPTLVNTITTTTLVFCSPVSSGTYTLGQTATSGGSGTYTYNWQVSTDGGGSWNDASGTRNGVTYQLPAITNGTAAPVTYQFRRQVTSGSCTSNSAARLVTVNPAIGNNTITAPTNPVCYGTAPGAFTQTTPDGGDGVYSYIWQRATNASFSTGLTQVGTSQAFTETSTTLAAGTYYYRRTVSTSGTGCSNTSATVTVVVQPAIVNTIGGTQTICHNTTPSTLTNSSTSGGAGAGTYNYLWQVNIDGAGWNDAPGTNNTATYSPPALTAGSSNTIYSYRRQVTSGACATNTSSTITVTVKPYATLSNVTNSSGEVVVAAVTYGQNVVITPAAASVTSPVFKFWTDAAKTTQVATGGNVTVTTSQLTETKLGAGTYTTPGGGTFPTRYYISVSGTNYCDNVTAVPVNITVNKATLTVTADAKTKVYGNSNPSLTATITGYQYSETFATAGVTGTAPTISTTAVDNSPVSPPTYPITLSGGAYTAANYNFNYVNGALTVTPRVITVTAKSYSKQYGTTQTFPTDGSAITLTTGTLAPQNTITEATVTSTGAVATANVAGNTYPTLITNNTVKILDNNSVDVTSNYTINRLNGALTVTKVPLSYRAISLTKEYGSTVSFLTNGTAVTLESGTLVTNQVLTAATVTSPGQPANASVAGSPYATTITTNSIVIKDANGAGADVTANYDLTLLTGTITITAQPITIKANDDTKTYGDVKTFATNGTAVALSVGGPLLSGESITAATVTSTGSVASATVAGSTYPIVITPGTVQIFNGATNVTANYIITLADGALTVNPRAITVTPNFVSKVYGATYTYGTTASAVTVTGSGIASGQTLSAVSITSSGTVNTAPVITSPYYASTIGAGTIVIRDAGNADVTVNYTITRAQGQLQVTKAPLSVTAANKSKTYDGAVFPGPYTIASYSGFVNGEDENTPGVLGGTLSYGGTSQAAVNASGTPYPIVPSGLTATNYTISYVNGGLTISAKNLTINSSAMTKVYGSTRAYTLADVSVDASTPLASGDVLFSISQASTLGDPAKANVTPMGSPYTVTLSNAVIRNGSAVNVTANYNITVNTGTLAVTPLAINVKASPVSKVYGDVYTIPTNGSNVSTNGTSLVSGQTFTASTVTVANGGNLAPAPVIPTPGPYTLTPTSVTIKDGATDVTANYDITYQTDVLTVTKRQISVTANNVTKTYGTLHTFANSTSEVTVDGVSIPALAPNNAISALALTSTGTPANAAASVTPYPIVVTNNSVVIKDANGTGNDVTVNYDITRVNGGLTINKAALTFTAKNATKVYGDTYTFATDGSATTMTGSLVNGNTISVNPVVTATNSGATAAAPVAGTYATQVTTNSVTIIDPANSNADVTSNYNITLVPGTFTITKRQITVTAKDVTKTYGTLHTFANSTSEVTVTGVSTPIFAPNNAISALALTSTGTPANAAASATPYPIVITNNSVVIKDANGTGADVTANYDITRVNGGLTINKATLTFTAKDVSKVYGDTYTFPTNGTATTMTGSLVNGNTISVNPVVTATNSGATAGAPVSGTYATQITTNSVTILDGATNVTSNYDITLVPGTFTITKRQITVTAKDVTKTYGTLHTFANTASEVTVTGVSSPALAATNAISALTLTSTGTPANAAASVTPYPIVITNNSVVIKDANGSGTDVTANYDITLVNGGLTINKAALTFTAKNATKVYGDTYTFATDGSATTMTGSLVNGNTISVNPVVTATNSGATAAAPVSGTYATQVTTNSVTIIDPANSNADVTSNYNITLVPGTFTITKRQITVTAKDVTKTYGTLHTFANSTSEVTVTGVSTPIFAPNNAISALALTSTGTPANAAASATPYPIVITSNSVVIKDANGSGTDVTANYDITLVNGGLTINKAALTFTAKNATKVYGDTYTFATDGSATTMTGSLVNGNTISVNPVVTATNSGSTAGAPVSGTYATQITTNSVTILDGATNVTSNYDITLVPGTFTITKRQITVTAKDVTKTYGTLHTFANTASEVTVTGVSSPALAATNAISALTLTSTGTPANAAASATPYPIVITNNSVVIKDANGSGTDVTANYDITLVNGGLTINKAALTFTAKNATKVYGDTYTFATDGSATTMTGSLVNGNTISVNPVVTATNSGATAGAPVAGTYATQVTTNSVTIIDPANSNADVTSNYNITLVPGTFTITKRQITVTAKDVTKTYGTLHTFANSTSEVTVTGVSTPIFAPNNAISALTLTSTGTPANAAASVTPYPIVITNNSVVIKDANGTGADVTANYDITRVDGGLTINKATLTFTAKDVSKVYGDTYTFPTNGTATTMTGSLVNGNTISVNPVVTATNSGATAAAPVSGTYATQVTTNSVTIIDPANSNADVTSNYNITLVPGTFTITKRQITVTAKDVTKTYGTLHTFANSTSEVTVTGVSTPIFAPNNAISALALTSTGTPANAAASATPYPIVITSNSVVIKDANGTGADVTANYDITLVDGGLTINKATLTFTANNATKVYGDTYTFATDGSATTMTGSLVNGNTISVNPVVTASNSGATAAAPVSGTYATQVTTNSVTIIDPANSNADVTSNYNITLVPGTFTITKRQITVTAKDVTKTYGTLHTFANSTSEVTVTGVSTPIFAPNNAISALALTSTGTPANAAASATPYPIVVTNNSVVIKDANGTGADVTDNYDITLVNGGLTINKATLTFKANDVTKTYGDAYTFPTNGTATTLTSGSLVNGNTIGTNPVVTSTGAPAAAVVGGSPYTTVITPGSLVILDPANSNTDVTSNYDITLVDGALTINKRAVTFRANDVSKAYGTVKTFATDGTAVSVTAGSIAAADLLKAATVTSTTGSPATATVAGNTYSIDITNGTIRIENASNVDVTSSYDITLASGALTVTKVPLTIKAADKSKVYDAQVFGGGYTILSYTGFVNGENENTPGVLGGTLAYSGTSQTAVNAGTYPITPGGLTAGNYTITFEDGTLTISKRPISITAYSTTKKYNHTITLASNVTVTAGTLVPGDAISASVLTSTGTPQAAALGTYPIVITPGTPVIKTTPGTDVTSNYDITYVNGTLTVIPNVNPVANNDSKVTSANIPVTINVPGNDTDADGVIDPATVTIITQPQHGTLQINPVTGEVKYTPNPGYYGTDVFTYTIKDDDGGVSNVATVNITVLLGPAAQNDAATTNPATPVTLDILGNDVVGDAALNPGTTTVVTQPAHGTVTIDPATGKATYTPNPGFYGDDSFTYTVKDANGVISNVATATIHVYKPPVATNDAAVTNPSTPVVIDILANDVKGDGNLVPNTVTIISQPAHGVLSVDPATGKVTYTPNNGYYGPDVFTYTVKDQYGNVTNVATVNITVNQPPVANNDVAATIPDTPVTIDILGNDAIGSAALVPSTVTIVTQPAHGTLSIDPATGKVKYTPNPGYYGPDNFTYTVKDANGAISNVATVTINISQGPTAVNDAAMTPPNTPVTINILGNDLQGAAALVPGTVSIVAQPAHGTLSVNPTTGRVTYTPNPGYYGPDVFTYTVKDANGAISNVATVNITVPKPPTAVNDNVVANPGVPVTIDILANDVKGDGNLVPSTVTVVTPPAHGTFTIDPATGKVVYTPNPGYFGPDSFTYTVVDANGAISNVATVNIYVNKPPTATNDAAKTRMNVPVTLDILANDVKGDGNLVPSTVTIVTQPAHGTLSIDPATGKVVYTPANGYYGTDSFTYTVKDANGNISNVATASITINRPPLATNDAATTETDVPVTINLIANDAAYGTTLNPASIVVVAQPAHGTVTIRPDGTVIYTPAPGYEGTDVFTYTILDNNGEVSNVATVNLTILTVKPDLYVTKRLVTVAPNVKVGKEVEYEIEVTNLSRATANNVVITDPLPGNLGGANVTTTVQKGTASYDKTTKTITWNIPTLAFNEKSMMRLKVQVTSGGDIVNTVSVKSNEVDGNPANNLASATYSVSADTTVKDDIFIPNVVTPNGDGKNDKFLILGINRYPGTQLVIYNRWGNMVFHSKDYSNNWDGSGLNEGTYFYILTVPKPTGTKVYNGWVQLIR